jgi:hypothetical protein
MLSRDSTCPCANICTVECKAAVPRGWLCKAGALFNTYAISDPRGEPLPVLLSFCSVTQTNGTLDDTEILHVSISFLVATKTFHHLLLLKVVHVLVEHMLPPFSGVCVADCVHAQESVHALR